MKCSELWLREWVNPPLNRDELAAGLTMAGFEVEEISQVAENFTGVLIGQVLKVEKHPNADRLHLCEVDIGKSSPLKIVCGAKNVEVGMKVPVATVDAVLPGNFKIKSTSIRGVASEGMLCAARELGFPEESEGLMVLADDVPIGINFRDYFKLDDYVIDISITPNRGDCLSVKGIAREIAAITHSPLQSLEVRPIPSSVNKIIPITIESPEACPSYVGLIIQQVNASGETPMWLKERLIRSGLRAINPIVDVTNYVMVELGQPLHAFDLSKIDEGIDVRHSRQGEEIILLDGSKQVLDDKTLVIADRQKPLAIAGIMGGMDSSVSLLTQDIFLESAYFSPHVIARERQHYGLNSDSAYRFERGVDPTIQRQAILRAAELILEIAGGQAGEVVEVTQQRWLPSKRVISLSLEKVTQVLGMMIPDQSIEAIFDSLAFKWKRHSSHFEVEVPAYRFDLELAEDLIEEIARLYGYNNIPTHQINAPLVVNDESVEENLSHIRQVLCHLGYHEIISYSFIDEASQSLLDPDETPLKLVNPITADMAVMRTNLWPGLINTLLYNTSRQQQRIRLFEIGTCFVSRDHQISQEQRLAGLISGFAYPEQWAEKTTEVDFFHLKGDLESLFSTKFDKELNFKPAKHPALHPGQTAAIYNQDTKIGIFGAIHPALLQKLDLNHAVFVFDLDLNFFKRINLVQVSDISKFPEIRRDIAILVNQAIPAKDIQDTIKKTAGDWLKDVFIFDVYQGKGISPGLKSVALALIWQHPTRTLVDDEVTALVNHVIETLMKRLGAELRR